MDLLSFKCDKIWVDFLSFKILESRFMGGFVTIQCDKINVGGFVIIQNSLNMIANKCMIIHMRIMSVMSIYSWICYHSKFSECKYIRSYLCCIWVDLLSFKCDE